MGVAEGGQVLLSLATVEVVRGQLDEGVKLVDLGDRNLRSLARPERAFQVTWPGAPAIETGPGARRERAPGNLPRIDKELLGRDREVEDVRTLLTDGRIVTLTGVGGVGKTSLALGVAHQLAVGFADGVWFCELASVLDPNEVAQAVAATLGLRPQSGLSQEELVIRTLSPRRGHTSS